MADVESYGDDLKATMAELGGDEPAAEPEEAPEPAQEPAEAAPEPEVDAEQAAEPVEDEDAATEPSETEGEPAAPAIEAPEHWSQPDREFFASLPDDAARERVLGWRKSIERGVQAKFEESADARRFKAEMQDALKPIENDLALQGMSPANAIRRLVAVEQQLRQDPASSLEWLARQYGGRAGAGSAQAREVAQRVAAALGVDIGAPNAEQAAPVDPAVARIQALEAKLAQQEYSAHQAQQLQVQQALAAADTSIQTFANAKDASGRLAHPHFEAVRPMMGAMIQAAQATGETLSMDEAYQRAVWARPELRETMLKQQRDEAARKAAVASKSAVAKAKVAHTPKVASVNVPPVPESDLPAAELLRRAIRESQLNGAGART